MKTPPVTTTQLNQCHATKITCMQSHWTVDGNIMYTLLIHLTPSIIIIVWVHRLIDPKNADYDQNYNASLGEFSMM